MDRRPCMCLPFGSTKAGAGGTEAGQVGAPEEGLSGFEAGSVCSTEARQVGVYRAFHLCSFRPISLVSKVLDRLVCEQLNTHSRNTGKLPPVQSAY